MAKTEFLKLLKAWQKERAEFIYRPPNYPLTIILHEVPHEFTQAVNIHGLKANENVSVSKIEYQLLTKHRKQFVAWLRMQQ